MSNHPYEQIDDLNALSAGSVVGWGLTDEQTLYADIKTADGWLRTSTAGITSYRSQGFPAYLLYAAP